MWTGPKAAWPHMAEYAIGIICDDANEGLLKLIGKACEDLEQEHGGYGGHGYILTKIGILSQSDSIWSDPYDLFIIVVDYGNKNATYFDSINAAIQGYKANRIPSLGIIISYSRGNGAGEAPTTPNSVLENIQDISQFDRSRVAVEPELSFNLGTMRSMVDGWLSPKRFSERITVGQKSHKDTTRYGSVSLHDLQLATTSSTPPIPDQSPAPVRVEERDGRVSRITDQDSALDAAERDFNDWREPVTDHIQELLVGDFQLGTNHGRARDRLVTLATFLSATITEIKERQFRIGYEIERLGGLVSAYRSSGDDMPALSADVLEDLDRLRIALVMGISKLERWEAFHRAAAADPAHDGDANPIVVSKGLNEIATEMERRQTYFDPELPETFRFLAEAATDPRGATRTVVYGAVRSAENLISFLGRKALGIGASTVGAVERHISKAVAATLVVALSSAALQISGALPTAWLWLRPLLEALARAAGG